MIGWMIAVVLFIGFTAVMASTVNIYHECWWKSVGIVLLVEVGAVIFYLLVALMFIAFERGI